LRHRIRPNFKKTIRPNAAKAIPKTVNAPLFVGNLTQIMNNTPCSGGILLSKEYFMKKLHSVLALAILSTSLMGGVAIAQDHHDNHTYVEHKEWHKGAVIKHEDWDRADKVDYHQYHLSAPPRGYEWRMVDGYYVLVNSTNFQIRTTIRIP
jgi:Ni/Co efflux regulator RcnB